MNVWLKIWIFKQTSSERLDICATEWAIRSMTLSTLCVVNTISGYALNLSFKQIVWQNSDIIPKRFTWNVAFVTSFELCIDSALNQLLTVLICICKCTPSFTLNNSCQHKDFFFCGLMLADAQYCWIWRAIPGVSFMFERAAHKRHTHPTRIFHSSTWEV